jgi:hypothetical protein
VLHYSMLAIDGIEVSYAIAHNRLYYSALDNIYCTGS